MATVQEVVSYLNGIAPLAWQESYDNSGLLVGDPEGEVTTVVITVDVTEEVVAEAVRLGAQLIVAHHPIIFKGLKKLTGETYAERTVLAAVRAGTAIYAGHTNFDSLHGGVSTRMAQWLGLQDIRLLAERRGTLRKLVTFVPHDHAERVRQALWDAGAGTLGGYDRTSFNVRGEGTFRGNENTHPFVGEPGLLHTEPETRIETIFPAHLESRVIAALLEAHPYEEPAYDIYALENSTPTNGTGALGTLPQPMTEEAFLQQLKERFRTRCVRHSPLTGRPVRRVAVCGGTCSFLLPEAIRQQADVFVTADVKYHEFFDADGRILLADIGHYESEQVIKEVFHELLSKKFPNFALHFSKSITNPINYL